MCDGKDRQARLACRCKEDRLNIERLPLQPGLESGCREQLVQFHRQGKPVFGGEERVHVHHADLRDRRRLDSLNERGEVEVFFFLPSVIKNRRKQDMFPALDWIGFDAEQPQQANYSGTDALAKQLTVLADVSGWRGKRLQDGNRQTCVAARCVNGDLGRITETLDARPVLLPTL